MVDEITKKYNSYMDKYRGKIFSKTTDYKTYSKIQDFIRRMFGKSLEQFSKTGLLKRR